MITLQSLLLIFGGALPASAGCAFSFMPGADESEDNPHLHRVRKLGGGTGGGGGGTSPFPPPPPSPPFPSITARSIEGTETSGVAFATLRRVSNAAYPDEQGETMVETPNAREVSNTCLWDNGSGATASRLSDMLWQFGQFLDHDIDLTEPLESAGTMSIICPPDDTLCGNTGTMEFVRSRYVMEGRQREQINFITSLIDGSVVYGSDETRALELRTQQDGKLKTSSGNVLPFNKNGLENAGGTSADLFLAGDIRANEQLGLTAMVSKVTCIYRHVFNHNQPVFNSFLVSVIFSG